MQKKIIIWGASGHAQVVTDIIKLRGEYEIAGFLDDINPALHNTPFCGYSVLGGRDQLTELKRKGIEHVVFGFGDCEARLKLAELVLAHGFSLATAIHPQSVIAESVSIGQGTVVAAGAVVNAGAQVGDNVIINTLASVDHECIIEDGVHICPGVHLAGRVTVGRASWLGIGAVVVDRIQIGARTMIGAGSVVLEDVPGSVLVYGVPAKIIRRMSEHA